jgi:TetR/AcrR family transcriptional regulator, regulator of autoinduction and epiphytic fitness
MSTTILQKPARKIRPPALVFPQAAPTSAGPRAKPAQGAAKAGSVAGTPPTPPKLGDLRDATESRVSFRDKQFALREEAIIEAVNRQLTTKGFEAMVLDDIAAEVGIAKGSLYKHFSSKEELAGAALKQLLLRLTAQATGLPEVMTPLDKLKALLRYALHERCVGRLPTLPSSNEALRKTLMSDKAYMQALSDLMDAFGALIEAAIAAKQLRGDLEPTVLLFSLYARSCDPTFDFLRATGSMPDAEVVEALVAVAFGGFEAHA